MSTAFKERSEVGALEAAGSLGEVDPRRNRDAPAGLGDDPSNRSDRQHALTKPEAHPVGRWTIAAQDGLDCLDPGAGIRNAGRKRLRLRGELDRKLGLAAARHG